MRTENAPAPKTVYLKDYTPPAFLVESVALTVRIFPEKTLVTSIVEYCRHTDDSAAPLVLNGEHIKILSVRLDDADIAYEYDGKVLSITAVPDRFALTVETEIDPATNTRLEGLYMSGGNWCTQCEAEGFRTITCFPDRPDVMTTYTVRIEADQKACPVLLSNGNLLEEGALDGGRHYAVWHDPFPKPCYLFALVAGDLVHIKDEFVTRSGRKVDLRIYVRAGDEAQCAWAMESLIKSMKWDEDVYGREYQLDRFNIVAVSDFNMGAMENTSLNIFNTALVLAHPDTATDLDFQRVESVIAHEYFHNWSGNRVTCRDWFQLSLKEGLTVFRDQEFSADLNSRDVQRIDDVVLLRRMQFPEDSGPLAHPIRPDNYIEINNFYTVTVYEKGAEIIRMLRTLLGVETYRKATDLYFGRYDGMAVTCEDFVHCMEEASGLDLTQFRLWYEQAGTPEVTARGHYDEDARTYTLTLAQTVPATPGQPQKKPMHIPVRVGLVGPNGEDVAERLLELRDAEESFVFENIAAPPVPSILRGFSAPVKLHTDLSLDDLRFLMVHDSDGFNRWEAGQMLALRMLGAMLDEQEQGTPAPAPWERWLDSMGLLLAQAARPDADKSLLAQALTLPDFGIVGQHRALVNPDAIHNVRQAALGSLRQRYNTELRVLYEDNQDAAYSGTFAAQSRRALKNVLLRLLDDPALAQAQYDNALCMTDRTAALAVLADHDGAARAAAFGDFYDRFSAYALVIDKWFALQATAARPQVIEDVKALAGHAAFTLKNPNRARSLYGAFAMNNPVYFHAESGAGYELLAEAIIALNGINPQIAARMLTPFKEWRRYTPDRQAKMRAALERIQSTPALSADVYEIVTKSLEA